MKNDLIIQYENNKLKNNLIINDNSCIINESCYLFNNTSSIHMGKSEIINGKEEFNNFNFGLLKFIKIIGNHKTSCEFKNNNIELILCTNDRTYFMKIKDSNFRIDNYGETEKFYFCIDVNEEDYLICNEKGCFIYSHLFSKIVSNKRKFKIMEKFYKYGIKINTTYIALTSNKAVPNGEDKLILYNRYSKKFCYEISGYSFISHINGLNLISKDKNYILLCACKKYLKFQKNGILLVTFKLEDEDNEEIKTSFYETKDFEVYCFCQIFNLDKSDNLIFEENHKKIFTNYFLVGGFEKKKGHGQIKLFKIKNNSNILETKIEFIQDINVEKKLGLKGPISSIIQTKNTEKIIITCWDGNIYLFDQLKINYFLFFDYK